MVDKKGITMDTIRVRVGDLLPGCNNPHLPERYFPKLNWEVYEEQFNFLIDNPNSLEDDWPIKEVWDAFCMFLFKHIPTEDSPEGMGRAYRWEILTNAFRKTLANFNAHGYDPSRSTEGELPRCSIGADGKMYLGQGNKRVCLLRMFRGLDSKIDVKVINRHPDWIKLKHDLFPTGREELYQPVDHPDFEGWPVTQPCTERWEMMLKHNLQVGERVLDLGCHTGYFCRKFKEHKLEAIGVEVHLPAVTLGRYLGANIVHSNVLNYRYVVEPPFETCLNLSLIMHIFKKYPDKEVWQWLRNISEDCKSMFLDCVWGGYSDFLPFTPDNIGAMITQNTFYTDYKLLGRTNHENRPFFIFTK